MDWRILDIEAKDGVITSAKYYVSNGTVDTEGNWYFSDKIIKKPFDQVKEQDIADWIEKESMQNGVSTIKLRLQEQMKALENEQSVALPWLPKTFKLKD